MRVFLTGGTGFIGRHLVRSLTERGDDALVLTRSPERAPSDLEDRAELIKGDPTEAGDWQSLLAECDAVVHLAGESVSAKRWDSRFRQRLLSSRVDATQNVARAIAGTDSGPTVLVSASGIDYYPFSEDLGDQPDFFEDSWIEEDGPAGDSFLARVCRDWEAEAQEAGSARVVTMRTGLVCGRGGPLSKIASAFKAFVGGRLGSGKQWMSWIHIDDVTRAYLHAIDCGELAGPVNLVAPNPVRNREFARALGKALGRPSVMPAPAFAIRLALGEFAEYVLNGRRARSRALPDSGFEFRFETLEPALADLYQ